MLWHLLLFMFNYDYTLEEGGVESSAETNQQVSFDVVHQGFFIKQTLFVSTVSAAVVSCM